QLSIRQNRRLQSRRQQVSIVASGLLISLSVSDQDAGGMDCRNALIAVPEMGEAVDRRHMDEKLPFRTQAPFHRVSAPSLGSRKMPRPGWAWTRARWRGGSAGNGSCKARSWT